MCIRDRCRPRQRRRPNCRIGRGVELLRCRRSCVFWQRLTPPPTLVGSEQSCAEKACTHRSPNEVWSWDITKLMGPAKWTYFYLYVIIDIFSRRIVGWCVADRESATVFTALFNDATAKHPAPPGQLTLHADRGGPMRAKATALL